MINVGKKEIETVIMTKEILDRIPEDVKTYFGFSEGKISIKEFIDRLLDGLYTFTVYVYVPDTSRAGFGNDVVDFEDITNQKCVDFIKVEQEKEVNRNEEEWKKYQLDYKYMTTYSYRACRYKIGFKVFYEN